MNRLKARSVVCAQDALAMEMLIYVTCVVASDKHPSSSLCRALLSLNGQVNDPEVNGPRAPVFP